MILYTSDINRKEKNNSGSSLLRAGIIRSLIASAFCFVFSTVYNHFGHRVYSPYMTWLFLFPLLFGTAVYLIMVMTGIPERPSAAAAAAYSSGIATVTIGSALKGVFAIAGTSSPYLSVYWAAGFGLMGAAVLMQYLYSSRRAHRNTDPSALPYQ